MKTIPLTRGFEAIVDDEDFDRLNQWKWCYSGRSYALRGVRKGGIYKSIPMHREILSPPEGMFIDHINGNGLDNRRCNLRICTTSQNGMNKAPRKGTLSGLKGMNYRKERARWQAQIRVGGKNKHLGYFKTKQEAAQAYNKAAIELYGEFARLNPI